MNPDKKTPGQLGTRSRQEEWLLPEFVGIGHALEEAKLDRKKAFEQYLQVNNRVLYFRNEYKRTSKSIDNHRKALEKVVAIRSRRNSDRRQKEELDERAREKQEMQRMVANTIKEEARNGLDKSRTLMYQKNRSMSMEVKDLLSREFSWKREKDANEKMWMAENFQNIESEKKRGRQKINNFMSERNGRALDYYNSQIKKERDAKAAFEKEISRLSAQQMLIVNRLKDSYAEDDMLKSTLNKASDIELDKLEEKLKRPKTLDASRRLQVNNGSLLSSVELPKEDTDSAKLHTEAKEKQTLNPEPELAPCCCHKQPGVSFMTTTDFKTAKPKKKRGRRRRKAVLVI